jgi:hypothetical protein
MGYRPASSRRPRLGLCFSLDIGSFCLLGGLYDLRYIFSLLLAPVHRAVLLPLLYELVSRALYDLLYVLL